MKPELLRAFTIARDAFNAQIPLANAARRADWEKAAEAEAAARKDAKDKGETRKDKEIAEPKIRPLLTDRVEGLWSSLLDQQILEAVLRHWPDAFVKKPQSLAAPGLDALLNEELFSAAPALAAPARGGAPTSAAQATPKKKQKSKRQPKSHDSIASAYGALPSAYARGCADRAAEAFKAWLASCAAWSPQSGAGFPRMPHYMQKGEGCVVALDWSAHGESLPGLAKKELFSDADRNIPLTPMDVANYAGFDLKAEVERMLAGRYSDKPEHWLRLPTYMDVSTVYFIPRGDRVQMKIVVRTPKEVPKGSFFDLLAQRHPAEWEAKRLKAKNLRGFNAWIASLALEQCWAKGAEWRRANKTVKSDWISRYFHAAAVDFGVGNVASVAWTNGSRMAILSGDPFDRGISGHDLEIYLMQSMLSKGKMRELWMKETRLAQMDPPQRLSKADHSEMKRLEAAAWKDPELRAIAAKRAMWLNDKAHRISAEILSQAVQKGAGVIYVGKNTGWKTGSDMGRKENRRFHRLPHARIIDLLRHKAEAMGIAVAEVEESHTSAASFIHGDAMPTVAAKVTGKHNERPGGAAAPRKKKNPAAAEAPLDVKPLTPEEDALIAQEMPLLKASLRPLEKARRDAAALAKAEKEAKGKQASEAARKARAEKQQETAALEEISGAQAAPEPAARSFKFSGRRGDSSRLKAAKDPRALSRDWFYLDSNSRGCEKIHSDGQAANNTLRKHSRFACHGQVSLKHDVFMFHDRGGFYKLAAARGAPRRRAKAGPAPAAC